MVLTIKRRGAHSADGRKLVLDLIVKLSHLQWENALKTSATVSRMDSRATQ